MRGMPGNAGERRVTSVVSLHAFANSPNLPLVVLVDMQQEHLAKPRLLAISEISAALNTCRKVLDSSRRIGLPVAFVRMIGESVVFNRATPLVRWIEGFEPHRPNGVRTGKPVMLFLQTVRRTGEPKPWRHRAGEICGRGRLPVDLDRCVPSEPQGDPSMRCVSQPPARARCRPTRCATQCHNIGSIRQVYKTAEWIAATAPRKLSNGKGGGG